MTDLLTQPTTRRESQSATTASRRVLVVVDDACTAVHLCASVRAFASGKPIEALVVAPAHGAAVSQWYVDEDAARAEATHRLRNCLSCLSQDGIHVSGHLGDADPVHAITDALYAFDADEILLITAREQSSGWLRPSVLERVGRTFTKPVHHVAMPPDEARR